MPYTRDGDKITLTMTSDEYEQLLMILGYALGGMRRDGDHATFYRWLAFMNNLNAANPDFIPYEIPDEYREVTQ